MLNPNSQFYGSTRVTFSSASCSASCISSPPLMMGNQMLYQLSSGAIHR
jgi:hypothetical protein